MRFSDFREVLIGLVSAVQCTEENSVGSSSGGSHGNGSISSPVVPPLTPDKSKDPDGLYRLMLVFDYYLDNHVSINMLLK